MLCVFVCRMANVECHTKKGCTPFHLACKEGHLEISKLLHKHGADMEVNEIVTSLFNCFGVVMLLISFQLTPLVEQLTVLWEVVLEPKDKFFLYLGENFFFEKLIFYLRIFSQVHYGYTKRFFV